MFDAVSAVCCVAQDLMFPFSAAKPYFSACSSDHFAFTLSSALFQTQTHIQNHLCHKWWCEQMEADNVSLEREESSEIGKSINNNIKQKGRG